MTVVIAGAGIGGLTLALSLHQVGIDCVVYESVDEIKPLGVGINVLPHAVRELTELDLQQRLSQTAIETAELAYFSKHGKLIWSEPRGKLAGYNWPQFSVHRGQLQMLLLAATQERLGQDAVKMGHHLKDWEQSGSKLTVTFTDREGTITNNMGFHLRQAKLLIEGVVYEFGGISPGTSMNFDQARVQPNTEYGQLGNLSNQGNEVLLVAMEYCAPEVLLGNK